MAREKNRHYRISGIMGRYFVQAGNAAGLGENVLRDATTELRDRATEAIARTRAKMAGWFEIALQEKIAAAIGNRLPHLARAPKDPRLDSWFGNSAAHFGVWLFQR